MKEQKLDFAIWVRAFAVLLILACHFTQQSGNSYLVMSSQFFNIGNYVFFILSGFLYGVRLDSFSLGVLPWYKKRIKRIYIPYVLMLIFLFMADYIYLGEASVSQWCRQFIGCQGWDVVFGASQTWFITTLLICYFLTPILAQVCGEVYGEKRKVAIFAIILLALQGIVPYVCSTLFQATTLITPIFWYALAFVFGVYYDRLHFVKTVPIVSIFGMCFLFGIRLLGRSLYDGTLFYDEVVVGYTHGIGAFCIFLLFVSFMKNKQPPTIVIRFADISFEVYLWHYIFVDGPLRVFGLTGKWITDCLVVFVISVVVARGANLLSEFILKKIETNST